MSDRRQPVLVVDDEQYYRDTIRDALALDGIECDVAAGPAELLKAIEDPRVACVVLDVKLVAPDAIALLETLFEQRPALRVIALATQDDQELVLDALHSGACDYLAKPIHDEELCLAVRRALRGHAVESRFEALREQLWRLAERGDATRARRSRAARRGGRGAVARAREADRRDARPRRPAPAPEPRPSAAASADA